LKGTRIGNAEISPLHGNFFHQPWNTQADDIRALIELVQKTVKETRASIWNLRSNWLENGNRSLQTCQGQYLD
jgi:hypothetical protein